ncbi:MAG TPA: hypothetical protein VKA21_14385, partial [Candidatus Binatia bacterium]|nr:hypothetical protein [Candidatus Binatia bacterium]
LELVEPRWLEELLGHALRPAVGGVAPKLVYADGTIAHAGSVLLADGTVGRPFQHMADAPAWTTMGGTAWTRNHLALPAACLAVRRDRFEAAGRFDAAVSDEAAAAGLCLALVGRGLWNVYTPHTRVMHHGCDERGEPARVDVGAPVPDPFWNPNLSTRVFNGRPQSATL